MKHQHLTEKANKDFAPKGKLEIYGNWYYILGGLGWLCLVYSAIASSSFYEAYLVPQWFGEWAFATALLFSAFVAFVLALLSEHAVKHWYRGLGFDFIGVLAIGLFAVNGYTDFVGSPEIAPKIHATPTDQASPEIEAKISGLQTRIDAIFWKYRWCAKHGKKHEHKECKAMWLPSTAKELKDTYAKNGYTPKADRKQVAQLEQQKGVYLAQLGQAQETFTQTMGKHKEKVRRAEISLRGGVIGCTLIFLSISIWRIKLLSEVAETRTEERQPFEPERQPFQNPEKEAKTAPRQPLRQERQPFQTDQAEDFIKRQAEEIEALREELTATREQPPKQDGGNENGFS